MVMSKKTTIVQLKISRMMIDDVNKHSGLRGGGGGTFKKACKCGNEEMMCSCLGCRLEMRKCSGGKWQNDMKSKKKRSFWRSTIFDHLPPCGLGDYILHSPLFTTDCKPQHRVTSIATAFGPPNFQMEITPLYQQTVLISRWNLHTTTSKHKSHKKLYPSLLKVVDG